MDEISVFRAIHMNDSYYGPYKLDTSQQSSPNRNPALDLILPAGSVERRNAGTSPTSEIGKIVFENWYLPWVYTFGGEIELQ